MLKQTQEQAQAGSEGEGSHLSENQMLPENFYLQYIRNVFLPIIIQFLSIYNGMP